MTVPSSPPASLPSAAPPQLSIVGPIATLTLQRPGHGNRLQAQDLPVMRSHLAEVNASDARVLVLGSIGRHFCSGYDLDRLGADDPGTGFDAMVDALEDCRAVTIAAIQGGVYGGATDLALACDFRIGSGRAEMFMPAARLGLHFYRRGLERYVTRLGLDTAKRLFLTAETLDARAMRAVGFLTELVADDALETRVAALAETVSALAPLAVAGMKKHLNHIARGILDADAFERDVARTLASDDLREGVLAWREKRPPRFSGR
jgi:enoyl-CoA hydratase